MFAVFSLCDGESVMIAPYIDPDEKIEEVPKEVEIGVTQVVDKKRPCIRHEEKDSYHDREYTRNESRIMETSCEFAKFVRTFSPILDRIDDRVRDNI